MKQPGAKSVWLLTVGMSLVLSTAVCAAAGPALAPAYANLPVAPSSATPPPGNEIRISGLGNGSAPWTIVVLLTLLTLIPSILLCMTPFARLLIVFHFLRQALGLQTHSFQPDSDRTVPDPDVLSSCSRVAEQIYQDSVHSHAVRARSRRWTR